MEQFKITHSQNSQLNNNQGNSRSESQDNTQSKPQDNTQDNEITMAKTQDNTQVIQDNVQTEEYEIVEIEIFPEKMVCPDCGGITLEGLDFCDKCGGELHQQ